MLVMSCWRHQAKGKGIHDIYSTPPTKNLRKTKYTVKHGFNSCDKGLNQKNGYHRLRSNKHYANSGVSCWVQYYHLSNPPEADHHCGRGQGYT